MMQQLPRTTPHISRTTKINSWLFILFLLPLFLQAQSSDKDSAQMLDRQLPDTLRTADSDSLIQEITRESYEVDNEEEEKEQEAVFLPLSSLPEDSFTLRQIDRAKVKAQQNDEDFWYANYSFKKKDKKELPSGRTPLIMQPFFQTILWIIVVVGFVAFIIIFLSGSNAGLFRKNKYIREEQADETDLENIFAINYQLELEKAAAAGNYRLGVRLLFLRLLRNLSDRNIIDYKQGHTNFDYLVQLQPTRYYHDFFRLARHYEYSWYGQFSIEPEKFGVIRKEFENFDRKLN